MVRIQETGKKGYILHLEQSNNNYTEMKSFSTSEEPVLDFGSLTYNPIVIDRTHGHVPHYNITKHTDLFRYEKESCVETGKLKISKITEYDSNNTMIKQFLIDNLHLENYPNNI